MTFNELRRQIYTGLLDLEFDDSLGLANTNKIITGVLLYSFIKNFIIGDPSFSGKVLSLIKEYRETYKSVTVGLRNRYTSYFLMKNYIQNNNIASFLTIQESQVKYIYNLYLDKTVVVRFNAKTFSQYMYNVENTTIEEYNRLRDVHYNVMAPILSSYIDQGINVDSIEIYAISFTDSSSTVGKEITFKIDGIDNSKIITDIEMSYVSKYIYKISIIGEYISLILY